MRTDRARGEKLLALYVVVAVVFAATVTGGFYVTALFSDGERAGIQFTASATVGNTAGNTGVYTPMEPTSTDHSTAGSGATGETAVVDTSPVSPVDPGDGTVTPIPDPATPVDPGNGSLVPDPDPVSPVDPGDGSITPGPDPVSPVDPGQGPIVPEPSPATPVDPGNETATNGTGS
jgi:hypothetical protein